MISCTNIIRSIKLKPYTLWRGGDQTMDVTLNILQRKSTKSAPFFCAISYGGGMILAKKYGGRLNGYRLSALDKEVFPDSVLSISRKFLMDWCPVLNCKKNQDSYQWCQLQRVSDTTPKSRLNPYQKYFQHGQEVNANARGKPSPNASLTKTLRKFQYGAKERW